MPTPNTQDFTSAAFVFTALSATFDTASNDPRALNAREGRYNRAILIAADGTLEVIRVDGVTVAVGTFTAGTVIPIQCRSIQAASTCSATVLY